MKKTNRDINIFSMSALDLFASALGAFILLGILLLTYFPNTGDSPERVAEVRAQLQAQIAEIRAQLEAQIAENARQAQQIEAQQQEIAAQAQQIEAQQQEIAAQAQQIEAQQQEIAAQAQQIEAQQQALEEAQQELQETQEALQAAQRKKYLLVVMSWRTEDDVDLHVTDPQGREFYYSERTFPGSRAKFEEDNTRGPGNEIWLHPEATPGEYKIHYKYFEDNHVRNEPSTQRNSISVRGIILYPEGRQEIPARRLRSQGDKPLVAVVRVNDDGSIESVDFR